MPRFLGDSATPGYFNAIVVYDSWSGNTRQIAGQIAAGLNCPAIAVDDAADLVAAEYDLIVVGSPVHGGMPTGKKLKILWIRRRRYRYLRFL